MQEKTLLEMEDAARATRDLRRRLQDAQMETSRLALYEVRARAHARSLPPCRPYRPA